MDTLSVLVLSFAVVVSPAFAQYYNTYDGCYTNNINGPSYADYDKECVLGNSTYAGVRCCADSWSSSYPRCVSYCPGGSQQLVSWYQAKSWCSSLGRRLCTGQELYNQKACCGSGCGYDFRPVWTKDSCNPPEVRYLIPLTIAQEIAGGVDVNVKKAPFSVGDAEITYYPHIRKVAYKFEVLFPSSAVTLYHFHGPATRHEAGTLQVDVTQQGKEGWFILDPYQVQDFLDGLWYINIHTSINSAGELRGQIDNKFKLISNGAPDYVKNFGPSPY